MYRKISLNIAIYLLLSWMSSGGACWASPSGLNNIPTTEVTADKTLVLQGWITAGEEAKPFYAAGFKYGLLDIVELGLDSDFGSDSIGVVALQAKAKLFDSDFGFAALLGAEGVTFDRSVADKIIPYVAVSQDVKFSNGFQLLRLHGGYNFQRDNFGMFFGVDRGFSLFEQELIIRGDLKQVDSGDRFLISGGFLLTLPFNFAFEAWLSAFTEDDAEESVTTKLNYVVKF